MILTFILNQGGGVNTPWKYCFEIVRCYFRLSYIVKPCLALGNVYDYSSKFKDTKSSLFQMPDQIKMHCHIVSRLKCCLCTLSKRDLDYKQNSKFSGWCSFLCRGSLREVTSAALTDRGEFCPIEDMHMGPGMVPDFEVLCPRAVIPMSSLT